MTEKIVSKAEFEHLFVSRWARLRAFGIREIASGTWECSRLAYWLGLPWRCKLLGHVVVTREDYNWDAHAVESRWQECSRCTNYLGSIDD